MAGSSFRRDGPGWDLVRRKGIEPLRELPHWYLKPARLPIPPPARDWEDSLTRATSRASRGASDRLRHRSLDVANRRRSERLGDLRPELGADDKRQPKSTQPKVSSVRHGARPSRPGEKHDPRQPYSTPDFACSGPAAAAVVSSGHGIEVVEATHVVKPTRTPAAQDPRDV